MGSSFDVFSGRKSNAIESDESSSDDDYGEDIDDDSSIGKVNSINSHYIGIRGRDRMELNS